MSVTIHAATATTGTRIVVSVPGVQLKTQSNTRENPFVRMKRVRDEKEIGWRAVYASAVASGISGPHGPTPTRQKRKRGENCLRVRAVRVTFTRIAPGCLDDDNNVGAFKNLRDGVAEALGVDDGWRDVFQSVYAQEKAGRGVYGVRIEIEEMV